MTRADFYIKEGDKYTYLGGNSNNYDGEFEKATNAFDFENAVEELLNEENDSIDNYADQLLPWPWKNSKLTCEVFIFEVTKPKFWQFWKRKDSGILYRKACVSYNYDDITEPLLCFPVNGEHENFVNEDEEYIKEKLIPFYMPQLGSRRFKDKN